jgi:1,4-dihydroxy-6-naphthoate synthase
MKGSMTTLTSKTIRFGHSPDPDDAFMFYGIAKNKIDLQGFTVQHVIEDIESLNQRALKGELEVTAVSCHAYAHLADQYIVMRSGASVGDNYGPILVAKSESLKGSHALFGKRIAIPGKLTTAYLALQLYEKDFIPVFTPFDQILDAVNSGEVDFGLVIHEGQLTYKDHGLQKILDLGAWWFETTALPLPLGVDVIRRDLGSQIIRDFARVFKTSIQYSLDHRKEALAYAIEYGRGIPEHTNDQFVGMYVNDLTLDLGNRGEMGFRTLLNVAYEKGLIPDHVNLEFV